MRESRFYQVKGWKPGMIGLGLFGSVPVWAGLADGAPFALGVPQLVLCAWCIVRMPFAGVHVTATGLRIVNTVRTYAIPWDQIRGFTWGRIGGIMLKVGVELEDGRRAGIVGLPVGGRGLGGSSATALEALNRHLADYRAARVEASP